MGYPYENLDDTQFEKLVVVFARKLFGLGVQGFAAGVDGGRDARFEGTAERFPSAAGPWTGLTIIQAKHTSDINTHYSDPEFSSSAASSVLTKEMPRVSKLREQGMVNYLLVANRRLGANYNETIKQRLKVEAGMESAHTFIIGVEYLDALLLEYPEALTQAGIAPWDGPLVVSSQHIAEVILAVAREFDLDTPESDLPVVDRVAFGDKNQINKMSEAYASQVLERYLQFVTPIANFLADPANVEIRELYDSAVEDFQLKIVAHRAEHESFDKMMNYLFDLLVGRDAVLGRNRTLVRAMLFYMYWHCDIGESADAAAE